MRSKARGILSVVMSGLLLGGPLSRMAQAVDGVKLIDQNKALAGNVTPGDAPGFPVTLSQPGSYRLASNLTVPDENTTAIQISADNVTLDLNGFTIQGPTVCAGSPLVCAPIGTGFGVNSFGQDHVAVLNGMVRGMGLVGISLGGDYGRVEQVSAMSNGREGIFARFGTVRGNIASINGDNGIRAVGSTVSGNTATSNGGDGIECQTGCTVSGNMVSQNGLHGIFGASGSIVTGNTARNNGQRGMSLGDAGYTHNVLSGNFGGSVVGGVSLGQNLCDGVVC